MNSRAACGSSTSGEQAHGDEDDRRRTEPPESGVNQEGRGPEEGVVDGDRVSDEEPDDRALAGGALPVDRTQDQREELDHRAVRASEQVDDADVESRTSVQRRPVGPPYS